MISTIYSGFILLYLFFVRIAASVNPKARMWIRGRKNILSRISAEVDNEGKKKKIAWFHCSSLGEFEQGRPVIEGFRKKFPDHRILLTFFSPSGYEIRNKYDQADWVFYLPADTKRNARTFLDHINPGMVFFIKYEYWYNYLDELFVRNIPVYIVSAVFRENHYFFSWYGSWFRKQLKKISWFFLQEEESQRLLNSIGIERCSVSGDTRFDRVESVALLNKEFPMVRDFCRNSVVLLAGSTWPEDEQVIFPLLHKEEKIRFIIAPHETDPARINALAAKVRRKVIRYSEAEGKNLSDYDVLLIDSIGILAHLYKYATVAYIGGGFGKGIHNILEATAFGVPVIFGPNYSKFREALELSDLGGAIPIHNTREFEAAFHSVIYDPGILRQKSETCRGYIARKKGATRKILEKL